MGTESLSSSSGNWSAAWYDTDQIPSGTPEEDRTNTCITTFDDFAHRPLDIVVFDEFVCGEV